MTGVDVGQYPVTPLEPSISRQKLYQIAREELIKSLDGAKREASEDEDEFLDAKDHHDDEEDEDLDSQRKSEDRRSYSSGSSYGDGEEGEVDDEDEDEEEKQIGIHLSGLNIGNLPPPVIDLLKNTVSKLNLSSNWLTSLPPEFRQMKKLTYLDISKNRFSEFPMVLCQCPGLFILDISRNHISTLPKDLGKLRGLKCLSMFENKFEYLPPSIADMHELQILEVENNPFKLPPQKLIDSKEFSEDPMEWLETLKEFVIENKTTLDQLIEQQINEQNAAFSTTTTISDNTDSNKHFVLQQPPPGFRKKVAGAPPTITRSFSEAPPQQAYLADTPPPDDALERNRSLSESLASSRAAKRMGFVVKKPGESNNGTTTSTTGTTNSYPNEISKHARNLSHDSNNRSDSENETKPTRIPPQSSKPPKSRFGSLSSSPVLESVSGAYFRRLSTLTEEMKPSSQFELEDKIVEACRKILYSLGELHSIIRRCSSFCEDKSLSSKLTALLHASKITFPSLINALEKVETKITSETSDVIVTDEDLNAILDCSIQCLAAFRNLTAFIRANIDRLTAYIDIKFIRAMIVVTFQSFNELHNAWYAIYPNRTIQRQHAASAAQQAAPAAVMNDALRSGENLSAADDYLYERIYAASNAAQSVLGQLTEAISKSAVQTANSKTSNHNVTVKVRDLTGVCVTGVEVTKRLKSRMEIMRDTGQMDRRKFWDDVNAFLKAVIGILASTKSALDDLPILNDVRPNLTTLTRLTKEIPALVEYSSYNVLLSSESSTVQYSLQQQQQGAGGMTGSSTSSTSAAIAAAAPPPTTPLVAALGPTAAQAVVLSPSMNPQGYSPFIPDLQQVQPTTTSGPGSSPQPDK